MRFEQFMENANEVLTVYHGDNHGTRSLDPRLMNHGNNQEGIGIYFSDRIETARYYGRHVVKAEINLRNFVNARAQLSTLSGNGIIRVLLDMKKVDAESMYYLVTDFGVFLTEPEALEDRHVEEIFSLISAGEIRNFQIEMAQAFGVEEFVRSWNRHVKIDGTFNNNSPTEIWFAIINPDIKVTPVP